MSTSIFQRKEESLNWLAYASLKQWDEPTDLENISFEKARIERVISDIYSKSKDETEFNEFCLNWIKLNGKDLVYTDKFTYDISIPDEQYELNVNTIIDKMERKKKGSKY